MNCFFSLRSDYSVNASLSPKPSLAHLPLLDGDLTLTDDVLDLVLLSRHFRVADVQHELRVRVLRVRLKNKGLEVGEVLRIRELTQLEQSLIRVKDRRIHLTRVVRIREVHTKHDDIQVAHSRLLAANQFLFHLQN